MPIYDYRLAANYNVALGSLVNIENITATGDKFKFHPPQAYGFGTPGQRVGRLTGVGFRRGFPYTGWLFGFMSRNQYDYLSATYCGGTLEGTITIYTRVGKLAYARYNAVMSLPAPPESPGSEMFAFKNITIGMSHLVSL